MSGNLRIKGIGIMLNHFSSSENEKSRVERNWVTTLTPCVTKHICLSLVPTFRGLPLVAPYPWPPQKYELFPNWKTKIDDLTYFPYEKPPWCITAGGGGCHITYWFDGYHVTSYHYGFAVWIESKSIVSQTADSVGSLTTLPECTHLTVSVLPPPS